MRASTDRTLAFLRAARVSSRQERRKNSAYVVYLVALFAVFWAVPLLAAAARAGGRGDWHGETARQLTATLPWSAPLLTALVLLLTMRNAAWRGPVRVDLPTLHWLLPLPLARGPLLLPRLRAAVLRSALVGPVVGAVLGYVLYVAGAGAPVPLAVAGAWAGLVAGLTGVGAGVLVERWGYGRPFWVGSLAVAVAAAVLPLWSGPWGWAAQPLVAAAGHGGPWAVGAGLSAVCAAGALVVAWRSAPLIPAAELRSRATLASQVTASLFALDLRQTRAAVRGPRRGWAARQRVRLPMPRRRWLLVPWRDATGLLREPGRLVWGALWAAAAVWLCGLAPDAGRGQVAVTVLTLGAGYLAAAQLVEPARLESDDFRRATGLPYTFGALALWHAVVPGVLLLLGLAAGAILYGTSGHLALLGAVPALVGGALVSAYRGAMPVEVLIGGETPMGNTGPLQAVLWYGRGVAGALALAAPCLLVTVRQGGFGVGELGWLLLAGLVMLGWGRSTARRLRGGRRRSVLGAARDRLLPLLG
ncbi:hypothetical protein GCM10010329_44110 [Streptomyces spiroverticillatus]|uniref:Uncharacterized protein n=1 Tax=Streptomyces finlayi TaxID=67296 RepID=A0A919CAY3_9ACTN|nr:DUF6297 family protein [Streptomyces finlayi]GHA16407.1 hypothetical protein GCM10010329_44110 [Streptomyces spiroverticillatus]GHC98652.1 hypothetical protein GCM10010334_41290 [Streptomyces finlayi]